MKRIYLLFILCCAAAISPAQAPITLSNANMPGSGDTLRYTNIQLGSLGNYQQTGANFSWNFNSVVSTSQGVRSFKSALLTPYAFFFLSPNEYGEKIADTLGAGPLVITNYYDFYKKSTNPNAFIADGAGITFSSIPVPSYYSDKDELYNFPMSYPKYDSTTFRFATLSNSLIPVRYSKTGYRVTVVDGWGTITTPYGTSSCLRLVTTQYSKDTVKTSLGPITIPFGFPNYVRSYQWLTTSSKIPYLEITGNLVGNTFTPTTARYRGYPLTTSLQQLSSVDEIKLFPNPTKDKLYLSGSEAQDLTVEIVDVQGRLLLSQNGLRDAAESWYVDVQNLQPGLYLLKASYGGKPYYQKFIKQ